MQVQLTFQCGNVNIKRKIADWVYRNGLDVCVCPRPLGNGKLCKPEGCWSRYLSTFKFCVHESELVHRSTQTLVPTTDANHESETKNYLLTFACSAIERVMVPATLFIKQIMS